MKNNQNLMKQDKILYFQWLNTIDPKLNKFDKFAT